jgi:PAS domain S-box-containing protein
MLKERSRFILPACCLVGVAYAVLQFRYPSFIFFDGSLIICVLLTTFLDGRAYTRIFLIAGTLLIGAATLYTQLTTYNIQALLQHLFSWSMFMITGLAVLYIKKLYASVMADKQQVNALFEYATEGIILTNHRGEIVLVNPAALKLFNYGKEALIGKPIEALIPGRFHGSHIRYRQEFNEKPANRTMGHGRNLFAKTSDGKEFPVEVSLSYYRQNNEFYVIAFIVDITERKESEQKMLNQRVLLEQKTADVRKLNAELETKVEQRTMILQEALRELEKSQREVNEALNKEKELNEIKSRFVSMASHEFRTPLSTVLSSAALISRYTKTEEQDKRDKHIKRIKDSVRHLNELLSDFLSLGRLDEGKVETMSDDFNVKEFLEEVVDEMRPALRPSQSITSHYEGAEMFSTDKRLLKNILINLLGNAIKFSGENQVVRLETRNESGRLVFSVQDEGVGISEEDQQHLFSSFFRGKNVVNIEGTGLGLHIVRRYIDLLRGEIRLESQLNVGTRVEVKLPGLNTEQLQAQKS